MIGRPRLFDPDKPAQIPQNQAVNYSFPFLPIHTSSLPFPSSKQQVRNPRRRQCSTKGHKEKLVSNMDLKPFKLDIDELINEFAKGGSPTFAEMKRELKNLRNVVAEAKAKDVKVVPALVKRMLDRNMFLLGFVDVNESSVAERLDELTEIQNASIQIACKKLFANTRIEHFTHMDMELELEVDLLKQKSAEYARAKDLSIKGASEMVDVENIKHITENQTLTGDVVRKTADDWKAQKELFYQKTGICHQPVRDSQEQDKFSQQEAAEEQDGS